MGALIHAWAVSLVLRSAWPWIAPESVPPVEPVTTGTSLVSRLEGTWVLPSGEELTLRCSGERLHMSFPYFSRATGPFTFRGEAKATRLPGNQFRIEIPAHDTWLMVDGFLCRTTNVSLRATGEIRESPGGGLLMHRCEFEIKYDCPHTNGDWTMDCGGTWK